MSKFEGYVARLPGHVVKLTYEDVRRIIVDSVGPGYCTSCGAESAPVENDCEEAECEICGEPTVQSILVILGLMC